MSVKKSKGTKKAAAKPKLKNLASPTKTKPTESKAVLKSGLASLALSPSQLSTLITQTVQATLSTVGNFSVQSLVPALAAPIVEMASLPKTDLAKLAKIAVRQSPASAVFALSAPTMVKREGFRLDQLRRAASTFARQMDPRLQMAAARARRGMPKAAQSSASVDEIPVIAKVTSFSDWENISEVRPGANIGQDSEGNYIVTGRIPVRRVEAVRAKPCIVSLKAAQAVLPSLKATLEETAMAPTLLPAGVAPDGGAGVVIGIVDFGCDFAHKNFRTATKDTRLEAIWDQSFLGSTNSSFGYGRVYEATEINAALKTLDPYSTLGYGPAYDTASVRGAHGTHVMDIAAGSGPDPGCAPKASLIFVDLSSADVPWPDAGHKVVGKSFGDSVQLLEALKFIFTRAGTRPCVINLSLGTNGGPHDGSTLVEQGIDALVKEKPNRSVVIAASNSHDDGIHAAGTVAAGGTADLTWIQPYDYEPAEMEIWLPSTDQAAVELIAPDGTSVATVAPGQSQEFVENNLIHIFIANRLAEPNNAGNSIGIYLAGAFEAGQWTIKLHERSGKNISYHAWIERYDSAPSKFAEPHDNSHTLGSISCGRETIAVGSYDAHKSTQPISWFSSEGPTRDGRQKPEISGPGHDVIAAWSRTGSGTLSKSGTSMAAPAVTGLIALIYAQARLKNRDLSASDVRQLLIDHARKSPPPGGGWDPRYGHGRISSKSIAAV